MSAPFNYRNALLVGIGMPAFFALADRTLAAAWLADFSTATLVSFFALSVVEIGIAGWAVGRYVSPWPLRWFIWIWTMVLMDLELAVMGSEGGYQAAATIEGLATAVLSAQFSAAFVWGILGSGRFAWRVPALVLLGLWLVLLFLRLAWIATQSSRWFRLEWPDLIAVHALVLSMLCSFLRLRGYALRMPEIDISQKFKSTTGSRSLQFSIRHLMIGTTSLAVFLAIARAGDFLNFRFLKSTIDSGYTFLLVAATTSSIVMLVGLWAALGRGAPGLRIAILAVLSSAAGWCLAAYCASLRFSSYFYALDPFVGLKSGWIGWMLLTGGLLAAALLIYRAEGYRLMRSDRILQRNDIAA